MKRSIEQFSSHDGTKRLKYASVLAGVGLTLTGCMMVADTFHSESTPQVSADASPNVQALPVQRPLDDLKVIKIIQPDEAHQQPKYSDAYIVDEIRKGGARLAQVTQGELQVPYDIPISVAVVAPQDTVETKPGEAPRKCFSFDQIYQARADVLNKLDQPLDSRTAVIMNEGDACLTMADQSQQIAAAWAANRDGIETTIFNEFSAPTFDHEIGHQEGLVHTEVLNCLYNNPLDNGNDQDMIYSKPLQPLLDGTSCDISKGGSGALLRSNNEESVMGDMGKLYDNQTNDPYTFYELNHIAPDVAKSQAVDLRIKQTYRLSVAPGSLRMLTLDIPPTHPLHAVDPTIKQLTIGLNQRGIAFGDEHRPVTLLRLIAVGDEETHQFGFIQSGLTEIFTEPTEIYRDDTLKVRIIEECAPDGLDAFVTIEPIE